MSFDFLKKQVFAVDGLTLTVGGLALVLIVAYVIFVARKG